MQAAEQTDDEWMHIHGAAIEAALGDALRTAVRERTADPLHRIGELCVAASSAASASVPAGVGLCSLQGVPAYQEDRVVACSLASGDFFVAVYDGHSGGTAAEYCATTLHCRLGASVDV